MSVMRSMDLALQNAGSHIHPGKRHGPLTEPHKQTSNLEGVDAGQNVASRPGRNFKPITSKQPTGLIIPLAAGDRGCLMPCRQGFPAWAPNGQQCIPWYLMLLL